MNFSSIKKRYSNTVEISKEEYDAANVTLSEGEFNAKYSKSSFFPQTTLYAYMGSVDQKEEYTHYYKTEFDSEQAMMFILDAIREETHYTQKIFTLLIVELVISIITGIIFLLAVVL